MPALEILCVNGHRVKITVTPNTTLLQVLEEACREQNLGDAGQYILRHNLKAMDLSLPFRFANLTNNAKLEMHQTTQEFGGTSAVTPSPTNASTSRKLPVVQNDSVKVALQFPSGQRTALTVPSSTTLWDVLQSALLESQTALPELDSSQAHALLYLSTKMAGQDHLQGNTLRNLGVLTGSVLLKYITVPLSSVAPLEVDEKISRPSSSNAPQVVHTPMTSSNPSVTPFNLPSSNTIRAEVMETEPSVFVPGRSVFDTAPVKSMFSSEEERQASKNKVKKSEPRTLGEMLGIDLSSVESPSHAILAPEDNEFASFKFPEPAPDAFEASDLSELPQPLPSLSWSEREIISFRLDSISNSVSPAKINDESDDVYEFTEADARRLMTCYRSERQRLDAPMMTAALRDAKRLELYSRYSRCIIQFHLPQMLVLQSLFHPQETLQVGLEVVAKELRLEVDELELYITPPKKVFKKDSLSKTFLKLDLMPMSKVFVHLKHPEKFQIDCLTLGSYDAAWSIVGKYMNSERDSTQPNSVNVAAPHKTGSAPKPKWLKLGKN